MFAVVEDRIRVRLGELSGRLGCADWFDGAFRAGDVMMVAVLLRLKASGTGCIAIAPRLEKPRREAGVSAQSK